MQVENQIMYHYHKIGIYDDIWKIGNEITIDKNFKSNYCEVLDSFKTGIQFDLDEDLVAWDCVMEYYKVLEVMPKFKKSQLMEFLEDAKIIIRNASIYNRESALEKYRREHCPNLPSRLNSIWLSDDKSIGFWSKALKNDKRLLEVSVTGNLFKSSDIFLPNDGLSSLDIYNNSKKYWEPNFQTEEEENSAEYLFQGKVKILKEINFKK